MTQPKRSTSRTTGARGSAAAKQTTARKPAAKKATPRKPAAKKATARKAPETASARARTAEQTAEANIRKLNDQIIESGKEVGTAALDAYETALKAIASSLDRGSRRSDVESVSTVLRSVADLVDEVRKNVVPAARKRLK